MISRANLIILLLGIAIGFTVNGWRLGGQIDDMKARHMQMLAEAEKQYRAQEQAWGKQMEEARNAATKREIVLRRDADHLRGANDRLQRDLADYQRRLPELAADAVRRYAATLGDVFGECTERYTALAEKAGGHASDVQTLMDAWPE